MPDTYSLEDDAPARRIIITAGLLLVFIPLVQATSQLMPLQLGAIKWRFQAANVGSAVLLLPYLGLTFVGAFARVSAQRGLERIVGAIALLSTILLIASFALFILDALQLKSIVQSQQMDGFKQTCIRIALAVGAFSVAFALLAATLLRGSKMRSPVVKGKGKVAEEGVGLIVGQS